MLKKLTAILLLAILLFNWGGYRLLSHWVALQSEVQFQLAVDQEQYDESELLHIKVPASLPYGASNEQFDRVEGSMEINGVTYSYVKRRFYQDTLELLWHNWPVILFPTIVLQRKIRDRLLL